MTTSTADGPRAGRLQTVLACRPRLVDAGIVALLVALAVGSSAVGSGPDAGSGPTGLGLALGIAAALPLLLRRQHPLAVFAAVFALTVLQAAESAGDPGLAVLVALYSLAAYDGRRRVLAGAVLLMAAVSLAAAAAWAPPLREVVLLAGTITGAAALGMNVRTRRAYLAALVERAARLEVERDQQARLAVASERTRIARELHDVVAHSLTVMISLTDGAAYAPGAPEPVRRVVTQASAAGRDALAEMRRLVGVLREDDPLALAPQPGLASLDQLVDQARVSGLAVELVLSGQAPELPPSAALAVYRVVQESLTNVRKHARGATAATVRVTFSGPRAPHVEVEVTDDGTGAGRSGARDPGHGLLGMRERVALFGGSLEAGPQPSGGWRVRARLHLPARAAVPAPAAVPAAEAVR